MLSFIDKINDDIVYNNQNEWCYQINVINDVIIYKQSDYLSEMLHQKLMMLE